MARSDNNRRTGIFGGTFNPVHYGHLINAELIREQFLLDRILFIPSKIPVHKDITERIEPVERFEMTALAVADNGYFEVSPVEIARETPSYTITTIHDLRKMYPGDKLYLIIGSDSFNELDTWKSYKDILADIPLIVAKRPGSTELRSDLMAEAAEVNIFENPLIDISSSMIRMRVKCRLSIRYLTPDAVIDYIGRKELYKIEQKD